MIDWLIDGFYGNSTHVSHFMLNQYKYDSNSKLPNVHVTIKM